MIETYRGVVTNWECDMFDHMNVQFYQAKFDAASWHFSAHIGMAPAYFRQENRGLVAMEQRIRYYKELVAGDMIFIRSELLEVRSKSIRFRHRMYNTLTGDLSAETEYISVHINTLTRKSTDFPADIQAHLQGALQATTAARDEGDKP